MSRGSGIIGLGAMARIARLPGSAKGNIKLVRPLLDIAKTRLIATLRAAKIPFADDPSNRDPRFTRARLRELMVLLAREGLDARRLALLARRLRRADAAIEAAVSRATIELAVNTTPSKVMAFDATGYSRLPAEIALRLLGRAVAKTGNEGPVELAKLEALKGALDAALKAGQMTGKARFRRSLAGAMVTVVLPKIMVERAPPRRQVFLTTHRRGQAKRPKSR
jgi:tRNA(Ile)-lysidine synthase